MSEHFDACDIAIAVETKEHTARITGMNDIETLIGIWSMRPPPGTPSGEAWENGARQGYQWGIDESIHQIVAAQAREAELLAHIERLREALEFAASIIGHPDDDGSKLIAEVLAATPAQSLVRVRNQVLEEAAKKCEPTIWADVIRAMKEPE